MSFTIKRATINDIDALMTWKMESADACNVLDNVKREILKYESKKYYDAHLQTDEHIAGIVYIGIEERSVGFGGMSLVNIMPTADNLTGKYALITDIYIQEEFSGQDLETPLISWLLLLAMERGAEKALVKISEKFSNLLKSMGFTPSGDYMKLDNIQNALTCHCQKD